MLHSKSKPATKNKDKQAAKNKAKLPAKKIKPVPSVNKKPVKEKVIKVAAKKTAIKKPGQIIEKAPAAVVTPLKAPPLPFKQEAVTLKKVPNIVSIKEKKPEIIHKELRPKEFKPKEPKPEVKIPEVKPKIQVEERKLSPLEVDFPINVKDLSVKLGEKSSNLIKRLLDRKILVNLNQYLEDEIAKNLAKEFGFDLIPAPTQEEKLLAVHFIQSTENLKPRHPVVTFMGHVDHGKTSILDYIRKSKLAEQEHGGITQHIGAYEVALNKGKITFLDTPGHEAFTAMRARGATVTDIIVLVVAADDGVMPQTIEAIDHAKAAAVPIVVAINKADKAPENVETVKRQLMKYELVAEDFGGKTIIVPVSAKTGQGMDELLELILLEAEMRELKADFSKPASGVVIESNLSKGRGVEITLLIQQGILRKGDIILIEEHFGKVKAMFDSLGRMTNEATTSTPVKVLGLSGVPQAGEKFYVVNDEKQVRDIALKRQEIKQKQKNVSRPHITLEDLHNRVKEGSVKELNIILKADVQGSLEALEDSLRQIGSDEVKILIIHSGVGAINSSDVVLATASDAIIIGFHVDPDAQAKELALKEGVEIRTYRIIYEAIRELKAALEGMLEPTIKRNLVGRVLIRKVFDLTRSGKVAGCFVQKGKIHRNSMVMLLRDGQKIFEGKLSNLKRFKDDAREITEGMECGITLAGFSDIKENDIIDIFEEERIARKL